MVFHHIHWRVIAFTGGMLQIGPPAHRHAHTAPNGARAVHVQRVHESPSPGYLPSSYAIVQCLSRQMVHTDAIQTTDLWQFVGTTATAVMEEV